MIERARNGVYGEAIVVCTTDSILNDESLGEHKRHLANADVPCNACHDPHGV
jgi:hypothetical protein